jgi:AcrR family transcriptional regulator
MPRAGLSAPVVVDAALGLLDAHGLSGMTLAAVAARVGVAAPSLYKHVDSVGELQTLVAQRVLDEMTDRFATAVIGYTRDDAITRLLHAYRSYVSKYPARYAAVPLDPLSEPALRAPATRLLDIFIAVLRGYGLTGPAAIHATRCLRAMAHGFTSLEVAGGFGLAENIDETYDQLIRLCLAGLPRG